MVCPIGGQAVAAGVWRQPATHPSRTRATMFRDGALRKTRRLLIDAVRPWCDARPMRSRRRCVLDEIQGARALGKLVVGDIEAALVAPGVSLRLAIRLWLRRRMNSGGGEGP